MISYLKVKPIIETNTKAILERLGIQASDQALIDYCINSYSSGEWHYVTFGRQTLQGVIGIHLLKWDSDIYGIKIGSIGVIGLAPDVDERQKKEICYNLINKTKKYVRNNNFDMLVCRIPLAELVWIQTLETAGFLTADLQCPLIRRNTRNISLFTTPKLQAVIREAHEEDIGEVISFGKSAFGQSHLYADPRLPVDLSDKLHEEWLKNDILRGRAKFTFVAEINGELAGFISVLWDDTQHRIFGVGHGHIDLIAVRSNFQRQGVGNFLLTKALERLIQDGASLVTVSTQATNLNAIKLYQQSGFGLSGFEVTLHGWIDRKKDNPKPRIDGGKLD